MSQAKLPTGSDVRAAELAGSPAFEPLRRDLRELGMRLEIVGTSDPRLEGSRIETWVDSVLEPDTLRVSVLSGSRTEDVCWQASKAFGRILGFPSDQDIEAAALLDAFAYTHASQALGTLPAQLQLRRIRRLLGLKPDLVIEDCRRAALAAWSALSVFGERERDQLMQQIESLSPDVDREIDRLVRRWGLLAPATPEAARRALS